MKMHTHIANISKNISNILRNLSDISLLPNNLRIDIMNKIKSDIKLEYVKSDLYNFDLILCT